MLNMISHGNHSGTPLVIAHGLFGSGRNWGVIARRLSDKRRVFTLDMRNHGSSPWLPDHSYAAMAADLSEVITKIDEPIDLLGHSMGGKASMLAALKNAPIRRLIVADIAPVAYAHTQQTLIDAMQALPIANLSSRRDADAALEKTVNDPNVRSFLLQSLNLRECKWLLNLDVLTEFMPQIIGFPEISGKFNRPTLFLAGGNSDYVQRDHRSKIKTLFPNAHFAKIPNAGHWLHAERPRAFEAAVRVFLAE
jgi:pimeloyl-ACP methyl ester carboxylesterase